MIQLGTIQEDSSPILIAAKLYPKVQQYMHATNIKWLELWEPQMDNYVAIKWHHVNSYPHPLRATHSKESSPPAYLLSSIREMENHVNTAASSFLFAGLFALLFTTFHLKACDGARVGPKEPTNTEFIRTSCSATKYPILCFDSLSSYASTIQNSRVKLADAALTVSLSTARSTSTMMSRMSAAGGMKPREAAAVSDCMENLGDSVDELRESLAEMAHMRGRNRGLQINDIQTWVSAALTDEDTCMDGFAGDAMNGEVKNAVRGLVVNVAQLTSNALALINTLSSTWSSP